MAKQFWFKNTGTLEDAKELFHDLMKKYHPDAGGDTRTCQEINAQFDEYCASWMEGAFQDSKRAADSRFGDILSQVLKMDVRVEIIGTWIYCFESKDSKDELKSLGFWFSGKHKAWIFNGQSKKKRRGRYSMNQIKSMHPWEVLKEKDKTLSIA